MLIAAPRDPRALFEAFRLAGPDGDAAPMLAALDFNGASARQMHYAAFGRLSEAGEADAPDAQDARSALRGWLASDAFQKTLIGLLLAAYPEKQRLVFVHVPKCAGTDLAVHLSSRFPSIINLVAKPGWIDTKGMNRTIMTLVQQLGFSDSLFLNGHVRLAQYLAASQIRFGDAVFTVLREPAAMVLSKINFLITRFCGDPELIRNDTRGWVRFLDRDVVTRAVTSGDAAPLGHAILHSRELTSRNPICSFLGRGDAASAIGLCAQAGVEITEVDRYPAWMLARWGIETRSRRNASVRHVALEDLTPADLAHVRSVTEQDRVVYDAVRRILDATGSLSVTGLQLARDAA